jgi:atypical dual specificity phosphatase
MKRHLLFTLLLLVASSYAISSNYTEKIIKIAKYEFSLYYTKMTQKNWWTKIEPYNIYLGALPLESEGHKDKIVSLGVNSILSMVEDFELEEGFLNIPVKHKQWKEAGLDIKHIKAIDFNPLKKEEIEAGIAFLYSEHRKGHCVYVHCKAGRGRSATILVAFLMEHENISLYESICRLKDQRPEINLNTYQQQALIHYYSEINT